MIEINEFEGLIFKNIQTLEEETILRFTTNNDEVFEMYHEQDCCEDVYLEDICGDLTDLIDVPILKAGVVCKEDENACESGTWTFYILRTSKGSVTLRWYGASNGYYSEDVYIKRVTLQ